MNDHMYTKNYWPTPFYFYNGGSSYRVFETLVIKRYLNIDKQTEPTPAEGSRETGASSTHYILEDYNIKGYIEKARAVYDKSVEEYLKAKYPDY